MLSYHPKDSGMILTCIFNFTNANALLAFFNICTKSVCTVDPDIHMHVSIYYVDNNNCAQ